MNITSWAHEVNFIFWATYKHFFRRKGRIPTLLLTFALPKVVDRYCCQQIQGHFAAKQNKIAKAK